MSGDDIIYAAICAAAQILLKRIRRRNYPRKYRDLKKSEANEREQELKRTSNNLFDNERGVAVKRHRIEDRPPKKAKRIWERNPRDFTSDDPTLHFTNEMIINENDEPALLDHFKLTENEFEYLFRRVECKIQKSDTTMRVAFPARIKLEITLHYLATGEPYSKISDLYETPRSSVAHFLPEVLEAIYQSLHEHFAFPVNDSDWDKVAEDFAAQANFIQCGGTIHAKYIRNSKPSKQRSKYPRYYMNILSIIDSKYRFLYFNAGESLSQVDSENELSTLKEKLCTDLTNIPDDLFFIDNIMLNRESSLIPYTDIILTENQCIFNYRLQRAAQYGENAFGILKTKFRIFDKEMPLKAKTIHDMLKAIIALHNWLCSTSKHYLNPLLVDSENIKEGYVTEGAWRKIKTAALEDYSIDIDDKVYNQTSLIAREQFTKYYNSDGALPWQDLMAWDK